MRDLFGKRGAAAPAEPSTVDLELKFEPGFAVLEGGGVRLRIRRSDLELLTKRESLALRFDTAATPGVGVFDQAAIAKASRIAHLLGHGLAFPQVAKLLGEDDQPLRQFYSWAAVQPAWRDAPATAERKRLADGDLIPAVQELRNGLVQLPNGKLADARTLSPLEQKFKRVHAADLARRLRTDGLAAAALALGVEKAGLAEWIDGHADIMGALR